MRAWLLFLLAFGFTDTHAQPADSIDVATVQRHLLFLASDSLKGRGNYTPEQHQAAFYIAHEFEKAGLHKWPVFENYFQPFTTREIPDALRLPDSMGVYDPQNVLLNVVGVLPGKTKPHEAVIFSAHYDHLTAFAGRGDGIFNGANDNASGTAALITLAQFFAAKNNNERTLIFCAFAGEEIGLIGSSFFAQQVNVSSIMAMINIEMIGSYKYSGKNAFFITGSGLSSLQKIFARNLKGKGVKIRLEPDLEKNLFQRSDNYPFASKGVPAHTIMASDDDDACYHQTCDEVERLDLSNMTRIIQAIAIGAATIISGKDTPGRIR